MTKDHGVHSAAYDNLGGGWRIQCLCGFETSPCSLLRDAGEEMDDHFEAIVKEETK